MVSQNDSDGPRFDRDPVTKEFRRIEDDETSTNWSQIFIAGGAILALLLVVSVLFGNTPLNQQSAQNQPRVEGPAERSPPAPAP